MTVSLELLGRGPSRPDLTEDLVVGEADLAETLARWSVPAPVVVASAPAPGQGRELPGLDAVAAVLAAGIPALVEVAPGLGGPGPEQDRLVDLLAVAAHSGVGFGAGLVPWVSDVAQVWSLLGGAVAAITGADIRSALATPDPGGILRLSRSAREAVRDVITCVVARESDLDRVVAGLVGTH